MMALQIDEIADCAPFHIGGSVQLTRPLTVFFKHPETLNAASVDFPCSDSESGGQALQSLLDCCVPASFGKGQREVLDPTYRQALCLPADRLAVNMTLPTSEMLQDIHKLLQPAASSIKAELHKLNIYGPDGFFKSHVDTPHSPDMFGSLVVCLPTPFTGGELVLRGPGNKQFKHTWGTGSSESVLRWAAFYSDVEHEILPVITGYRVTLTFDLYHKAAVGHMITVDPVIETSFGRSLAERLKDSTWHPDGAILGFALDHKYATDSRMPSDIKLSMLKGSDLLLYQIVTRLGLQTKVIPLVQTRYSHEGSSFWGSHDAEAEDVDEEPPEPELFLGHSFSKHMTWQSPPRPDYWSGIVETTDSDGGPSQSQNEDPTREQAGPDEADKDQGSGWGSQDQRGNSRSNPRGGSSSEDEERYHHRYTSGRSFGLDESSAESERSFLSVRHGARNLPGLIWCKPVTGKHLLYKDKVNAWGNAPSTETWYVAAALLVKLPKHGVGPRAVA